jgi:hypothetical protein
MLDWILSLILIDVILIAGLEPVSVPGVGFRAVILVFHIEVLSFLLTLNLGAI